MHGNITQKKIKYMKQMNTKPGRIFNILKGKAVIYIPANECFKSQSLL